MKTNYERNRALDSRYGGGTYSKPGTVYIGLFTAAPGVGGGGTEVSGGSYARVAVTNNATSFPNAAAGVKTNGTDWVFAQATAAWGTVTHFGIFDALTSGNLQDFAPLTTPKTIQIGDTPEFVAGQVTFTET